MTDSARNRAAQPAPGFYKIPIKQLRPWPGLNPRRRMDEAALDELTASIIVSGVLEPLLVTAAIDPLQPQGTFWIVAGERRWRAAEGAGEEDVPCIVRDVDEAEALEIAITENVARADLSAVEAARSFQRWLELHPDQTQEELGSRIGRSQAYVSNRIRLLSTPEEVLALVDAGTLDHSWVRDHLLPYNSLREDLREKFHAAVAEAISKEACRAEETWSDEVFEDLVNAVARELGRPLEGWERNSNRQYDYRRAHKTCACGAPDATRERGYRSVYCFDHDWFNGQNGKAIERRKKAEAKQQAKRQKLAAEFAAPTRVLDEEALRAELGWDGYHAVLESENALVDPDVLPAESLAWAKGRYSDQRVVCLDMKAYRKAKGTATRERNRLVAEARENQAHDDRKTAARRKVGAREFRCLLTERPYNETVATIAKSLGMVVEGKRITVPEIDALSEKDLQILIKVIALRQERGELSVWRDPLAEKIEKNLLAKYRRRLKAIMPEPPTDDEPAAEDVAEEPGPDGPASEPAGRYELRPDREGSELTSIIDTETGEVIASGLTTHQVDEKLAELAALEPEEVSA